VTEASLGPLVDAFRKETAHGSRDAKILRTRILQKLETRRRRFSPTAWSIPLIAVLFGGAALAATSSGGAWLADFMTRFHSTSTLKAPFSRRASDGSSNAKLRPVAAPRAPRVEGVPVAPRDSEPGMTDVERPIIRFEELPAAVPTTEPRRLPPRTSKMATSDETREDAPLTEQLALYRAAHDSYFRDGALEQAAERFHAYLDRFPNGALSVEAKFNQGACLARLGRMREAARFLEPFARGAHGDYMKKAASDLLGSMPNE
jgi:TolA-binding protein